MSLIHQGLWTLATHTRELAPDVQVGVPPHNTLGLAINCAVTTVRAGADVVELSANGCCGGPSNTDLAATAMAFETLYGVRTGAGHRQLTGPARAGDELTDHHIEWLSR